MIGQTVNIEYRALDDTSVIVYVTEEDDGSLWTDSIDFIFVDSEETSTSLREPTLPEGFELSQNYPNPFNPGTVIEFKIPFNADVTLRVSDLTGRSLPQWHMPGVYAGSIR